MRISSGKSKIISAAKKREIYEKQEEQRVEWQKFMVASGKWILVSGQLMENMETPFKTHEELKAEFESWKRLNEIKTQKRGLKR